MCKRRMSSSLVLRQNGLATRRWSVSQMGCEAHETTNAFGGSPIAPQVVPLGLHLEVVMVGVFFLMTFGAPSTMSWVIMRNKHKLLSLSPTGIKYHHCMSFHYRIVAFPFSTNSHDPDLPSAAISPSDTAPRSSDKDQRASEDSQTSNRTSHIHWCVPQSIGETNHPWSYDSLMGHEIVARLNKARETLVV